MQLVMKTFDPPFDRYMADSNLETACPLAVERIIAETGPVSKRPIISFTLISETSQKHALLVRVSHAQYDGSTSPILFCDISAAYNSVHSEVSLQAATPFSRYLHARSMGSSHEERIVPLTRSHLDPVIPRYRRWPGRGVVLETHSQNVLVRVDRRS
jgi:hypothetical protein